MTSVNREKLEEICRRQVSVLSKFPLHRQRLLYIAGLLVLSGLLLLPLIFSHSKKDSISLSDLHNVKNYHHALEMNLNKLQQLEEVAPTQPPQNKIVLKSVDEPSKTDLLRQHAPTRMYESKAISSQNSSISQSSTFLEKTPYASFANQSTQAPVVLARRLAHPHFTVPQGEFVNAILETAMNSDLPGMIRAVISRPVYSYLGDHLLIPEGSRLIGQYSSQTLQGINRVMVIWQRILLPNGISIQVDSPGSDALGEAGFEADSLNTHFFQRFGESSLLSLLGAAAANWGVESGDGDNAAQRYRSAISQSFQTSASKTLNQTVSIKPTLRIHQGDQIIVFVAKDLDFYSVVSKSHVN